MKIGVYGGTFNPPHLGHAAAARAVMAALRLDRLLLIPAGIPPHKQLPEGTADGNQRLTMTRMAGAALEEPEKVQVLDLELKREGASYTWQTLETLKEQYP